MTDGPGQNKVPEVILDIFNRYVQDAPEDTIARIEAASGITVEQLTLENADPFLDGMRDELGQFMDEWKAKFVVGVIRRMLGNQQP